MSKKVTVNGSATIEKAVEEVFPGTNPQASIFQFNELNGRKRYTVDCHFHLAVDLAMPDIIDLDTDEASKAVTAALEKAAQEIIDEIRSKFGGK